MADLSDDELGTLESECLSIGGRRGGRLSAALSELRRRRAAQEIIAARVAEQLAVHCSPVRQVPGATGAMPGGGHFMRVMEWCSCGAQRSNSYHTDPNGFTSIMQGEWILGGRFVLGFCGQHPAESTLPAPGTPERAAVEAQTRAFIEEQTGIPLQSLHSIIARTATIQGHPEPTHVLGDDTTVIDDPDSIR